MNSSGKVSLTIRLPLELDEWLREQRTPTLSMSQIVEQAVKDAKVNSEQGRLRATV